MLTALHVENFVLIERLSLPLAAGLTALTGETGAGKSILLDALGLAAGARASAGAVRSGAGQGVVSAAFAVGADHPAWALLAANGFPDREDEIILRRVQTRDGKSRAFVNDRPVSVAFLKDVGETLVEIHGQHDGRGFLSSATHRDMLDDYAGLAKTRAALAEIWRGWREAAALLEEKRAGRVRAAAEEDYLRHVVKELGDLAPKADEEEALARRRADLQAAEKTAGDLVAAAGLLADDGLEGRLGAASRRLARAAAAFGSDHPAARAASRIDAALSEMLEARAAVEDAVEALGADPEGLEKIETRLFALRAAARKHGVSVAGLCGVHARAAAALAALDAGAETFELLEKEVARREAAYSRAAAELSKSRRTAAAALDKAVATELAPLKLGRAEFRTEIVSDAARVGADGIDQVEFMVATNPGVPAGPLKTIASGGELSRFVLAMKAALAAKERRTVVIFDEIDAGVGGAVADAVGERLARLARDAQVLVVTHSPQVAARATAHWRIEKRQGKSETTTLVEALLPTARIEEIARMLSGAKITDEARAAARRLLDADGAAAPRRKRA